MFQKTCVYVLQIVCFFVIDFSILSEASEIVDIKRKKTFSLANIFVNILSEKWIKGKCTIKSLL